MTLRLARLTPGFRGRLAGITLALGAPFTLALGASLFFLAWLLAPIGIIQAIAGLRVYGGDLRWRWPAVGCGCVGLILGVMFLSGIAWPIAVASVAVNSLAIIVALLVSGGDGR